MGAKTSPRSAAKRTAAWTSSQALGMLSQDTIKGGQEEAVLSVHQQGCNRIIGLEPAPPHHLPLGGVVSRVNLTLRDDARPSSQLHIGEQLSMPLEKVAMVVWMVSRLKTALTGMRGHVTS